MKKHFSTFIDTVRTGKRLLGLLWRVDKRLFIGSFVVFSIPAIVPFVYAYLFARIIDLIVAAVAAGGAAGYGQFVPLVAALVITSIFQEVAYIMQSYFDLVLWTKFPAHLYQMALGKITELDLSYFEDSTFKDRLERLGQAYEWRPLNMLSNIFYATQSLVQFLVALVAVATLQWWLVIVALIIALPQFVVQAGTNQRIWGIWEFHSPFRKRYNYLSHTLMSAEAVKEIRLFQLAPLFLSELKKVYAKFQAANLKAGRRELKINSGFTLLEVVLYAVIDIYILFAALTMRITVGSVSYYLTVMSNLRNGISGLFRNAERIHENGLYVKDVFELFDTETRIPAPAKPVKLKLTAAPTIEFRNVTFVYPGTEHKVLDDFSLTVRPGEKVAIVGENGAGKTTIIKLLGRFYDVTSGQILINGIDIREIDLGEWYRNFGVLFQDFMRYEYSLADNIFFGRAHGAKDIAEIIRAAQDSGADRVARKMPDGYDQMLGRTFEGGIDLSTGQWQKVALARGFLRNAPVLVLDEPTAAIDAKAEAEIFERVESLSSDKTVIIISHRFSTVRNADRIIVVDSGKVIESGSHKALMRRGGIYKTLFNLQAKGYK